MPLKFVANSTKFSVENAVLLAEAASTAYKNKLACQQWAGQNGFAECEMFSGRGTLIPCDTQGFVARNATDIVVAFRGTEPRQRLDWLADARFIPRDWAHGPGHVHEGFKDALQAVWSDPVQTSETLPQWLLAHNGRNVWITGHSLGGALAELCAARALSANLPVHGVYTFGQPRVGDEVFAMALHTALGSRTCRFINDRDIVPRVPLFTMKFRHYGGEVFFDHQGKPTERASAVEVASDALRLFRAAFRQDISLSIAGLVRAVNRLSESDSKDLIQSILAKGLENIEDHSMENYLPRIKAKLNEQAAAQGSPAK